MVYTLNLFSAVCQWYLNNTRKNLKKKLKLPLGVNQNQQIYIQSAVSTSFTFAGF